MEGKTANYLALLKADGRFAPLSIAASRTVNLGGTAATVGFPDIDLPGFAPKLANGGKRGGAGVGVLISATEAALRFGDSAERFGEWQHRFGRAMIGSA